MMAASLGSERGCKVTKRLIPTGVMLAVVLALAVSTALAGSGGGNTLSGGDYEVNGHLTSDASSVLASGETWRLGFPREGDVNGEFSTGQFASGTAAFRSAVAADSYFVLPASATTTSVRSAQFYVLKRTGAYSGDAVMRLDVLGPDGVVRRTASRSDVNIASAPDGVWTPISLASSSDSLRVAPGERLAIHCEMDAGAGGDLDVRVAFETQVGFFLIEHPILQYLPILIREY